MNWDKEFLSLAPLAIMCGQALVGIRFRRFVGCGPRTDKLLCCFFDYFMLATFISVIFTILCSFMVKHSGRSVFAYAGLLFPFALAVAGCILGERALRRARAGDAAAPPETGRKA